MNRSMAQQLDEIVAAAREGARRLVSMSTAEKDAAVRAMAGGIRAGAGAIVSANAQDMGAGRRAGLSDAMLDRLLLTPARVEAIAVALDEIAALPDPVGAILETNIRPNGLVIEKVRVPIGVLLIIYESRPNVTADAAALCFKAGNAVILRGGKEAARSNRAILDAMLAPLGDGFPQGVIQLVPTTDRAAVGALLGMADRIDLVIPRGGEGLIRAVAEQSKIPVLKHSKGVCHVHVDRDADLDIALSIAVNAKCQRPGVCNAMETLLVHRCVAAEFLPRFFEATRPFNVELRGCRRTCAILPGAVPATEADWAEEYLDQICAVRVVDDLTQAIEHIARHGSHHSDAIVTRDDAAAERFLREIDSAAVYVNASTRFTDGAAFGKGAEIGISTDKLHARGPCGLEELTTYKYVIRGSEQVRG
jgi:glutamate-5-semialdehyde dehydrogenase